MACCVPRLVGGGCRLGRTHGRVLSIGRSRFSQHLQCVVGLNSDSSPCVVHVSNTLLLSALMTDTPTTPTSSPNFVPGSPFDDPGADVILRSSDGVDFHLHRLVLSLASPFFKQMFALPQPNLEPGPPTIPVSESALVIDRALRFWYPGAEPVAFHTLDQLREVLEATIMKYDMQFLIPTAKRYLRENLDKDPISVFAIACRHEWKDVAVEAAKASLGLQIRTFESAHYPQLKYITGDAYHSLLHYHSECGKVAKLAASSLLKQTASQEFPHYFFMIGCTCPHEALNWGSACGGYFKLKKWSFAYVKALPDVLVATPAARLDSPELLGLAVKEVPAECSYCRTTGMQQLMKFAVSFRVHIATKFDSVELKLDF